MPSKGNKMLRYELYGFAQVGNREGQDAEGNPKPLVRRVGRTIFVDPSFKEKFEEENRDLLKRKVIKADKAEDDKPKEATPTPTPPMQQNSGSAGRPGGQG